MAGKCHGVVYTGLMGYQRALECVEELKRETGNDYYVEVEADNKFATDGFPSTAMYFEIRFWVLKREPKDPKSKVKK